MHHAPAGHADLTDLQCMATIPVRVASRGSTEAEEAAAAAGAEETLVKAESILANLQQRFKKDQIYVSV